MDLGARTDRHLDPAPRARRGSPRSRQGSPRPAPLPSASPCTTGTSPSTASESSTPLATANGAFVPQPPSPPPQGRPVAPSAPRSGRHRSRPEAASSSAPARRCRRAPVQQLAIAADRRPAPAAPPLACAGHEPPRLHGAARPQARRSAASLHARLLRSGPQFLRAGPFTPSGGTRPPGRRLRAQARHATRRQPIADHQRIRRQQDQHAGSSGIQMWPTNSCRIAVRTGWRDHRPSS